MHPFRKYISNYVSISDSCWNQVESCLTLRNYNKGELLLRQDQICRKLYFLESGYLRYFILNDGNEVTKYFTEPPYCFTSQRSFSEIIPAEDSIEVLQDAIIWEMSREDAFDLLKLPGWSQFILKLIQEVQFMTEQILTEVQNKTAEERYSVMVKNEDPVLQFAPLKHIASYLGIAPQSLSRIRNKFWLESRKLT